MTERRIINPDIGFSAIPRNVTETGELGYASYSMNSSRDDDVFLMGVKQHLEVGDSSFTGVIASVTTGLSTEISLESLLQPLNIHGTHPPFYGYLRVFVTQLLHDHNVDYGTLTVPDVIVSVPGWNDNLWYLLSSVLVVNGLELVIDNDDDIAIFAHGERTTDVPRFAEYPALSVGKGSETPYLDVHYFNHEPVSNRTVYPEGVVYDETITVENKETLETEFDLPAWVTHIGDVECVNSVDIQADEDYYFGYRTSEVRPMSPTPSAIGGAVIDRSDNLWVADSTADVLRKYNTSGTQVGVYTATPPFSNPVDVKTDLADRVIVADRGNSTIYIFSNNGTQLAVIPTTVTVSAVAPDPLGNIWVADSGAATIRRINTDGSSNTFTASPAFSSVVGIASGNDGTIWVLDNGTKRVYIFDVHGVQQHSFVVSGAVTLASISVDSAGFGWVSDINLPRPLKFSRHGDLLPMSNRPVDVASVKKLSVTSKDNLMVVSGTTVRVLKPLGVYSVSGQDNAPIPPERWLGRGGSLSMEITSDHTLKVTVVGADDEAIGPFTISADAGGGVAFTSLRVIGSGTRFTDKTLRVPTGVVIRSIAENDEYNATEISNYTVSSISDAMKAASGVLASPASGAIDTSLSISGEVSPSVVGNRFRHGDSFWRVQAQTASGSQSTYATHDDTRLGEVEDEWGNGVTLGDQELFWTGRTLGDMSIAPLRKWKENKPPFNPEADGTHKMFRGHFEDMTFAVVVQWGTDTSDVYYTPAYLGTPTNGVRVQGFGTNVQARFDAVGGDSNVGVLRGSSRVPGSTEILVARTTTHMTGLDFRTSRAGWASIAINPNVGFSMRDITLNPESSVGDKPLRVLYWPRSLSNGEVQSLLGWSKSIYGTEPV